MSSPTRAIALSLLVMLSCRKAEVEDTAGLLDGDGDGVPAAEDCDDSDATVSPSSPELCDGLDNNCNDVVDEAAVDGTTYYADMDGDGVGDGTSTLVACAAPDGYATAAGDCDDNDPAVHPGASETNCSDPRDYNCDGSVGGEDADGDGFVACQDCDDKAAAVNPDATEICDGTDNNCDGDTDEAGATGELTFYADVDEDLYGDSEATITACEPPQGFVDDSTDCNDANVDINPGAQEFCNSIDDNCNDVIDDFADGARTWYADTDGDGDGDRADSVDACVAPDFYVEFDGDCDPNDDTIFTGAPESCDAIDSDCNGSLVDTFADLDADGQPDCVDNDDDNDGDPDTTDCDDTNAAIHAGAAELCDAIDSNCDGSLVDTFANFDNDTEPDCIDADDDNDGDPDTTDCDDVNNAIHTGAPESCDAIDSDCNGSLVDTFPNFDSDTEPDCIDADDDNDGDPDATDCADTNNAIFTGATEACDLVDSNCNGSLVDTFANFDGDAQPDCVDPDDDNDGDPDASDCNDANNVIYTGAPESCDAIDSNCNGSLVDTFTNFDGDTQPDCIDADDDNDGDPDTSDCNDANNAIFTGAPESCDAIDSNCNGSLVDTFANFDGDTQPDCVDTDDDNDGDPDTSDCNDASNVIYTGAPESCDAIDSNCNGSLVDTFANFDGDAQPDCTDPDDDNDGDPDTSDCNDANKNVYTGAPESCDAIDSNCNGSLVDTFANFDGDVQPDCVDTDDDNDGDPDTSDCNDASNVIYTGAPESCDAIDSNCNGSLVDTFANFDGDAQPDCTDTDDDNDGDPDTSDCNDASNVIYTGAPESCDAIDSNCNGSLVDTFTNFDGDAQPDCTDPDDDNDGDPDTSDCNDASNVIYTGAPESCDAIDSNCNGSLVDTFANFDGDAQPDCTDPDDDNDGDPDTSDCNDANNKIYTSAPESCDSVDSNCNGSLVDTFANFDGDAQPDCVDTDDDNDGDPDTSDCNDANNAIYTGAKEICNGIDDNCNSVIDEGVGGSGSKTFTYTGSLQSFTVGCGISSITIDAAGAQGGSDTYSAATVGALGADIKGTFTVTPGLVLTVLVGGRGETPANSLDGGGGGGTFVWNPLSLTAPLIAAGGGGGAGSCGSGTPGVGSATLGGSGAGGTCGPINNGNGTGGGGAGWLSGGAGASSSGGCGAATGSQTPLAGGAGGLPISPGWTNGTGGYGGGGGGGGNCGGGGGGGGYTGGDGGSNVLMGGGAIQGQGGLSYNVGTSQTNIAGVRAGDGQVIITW